MKATGIVRRIDELGRIVIPKELRRTFKIREGTPLEIFCGDEGELILKKYSMLSEISDFASDVCLSLKETLNLPVMICDKDKVLSVALLQKNTYLKQPITEGLVRLIENRTPLILSKAENQIISLIENMEENFNYQILVPIISNGDTFGAIMVFSKEKKLTEAELLVVKTMANFISQQLG